MATRVRSAAGSGKPPKWRGDDPALQDAVIAFAMAELARELELDVGAIAVRDRAQQKDLRANEAERGAWDADARKILGELRPLRRRMKSLWELLLQTEPWTVEALDDGRGPPALVMLWKTTKALAQVPIDPPPRHAGFDRAAIVRGYRDAGPDDRPGSYWHLRPLNPEPKHLALLALLEGTWPKLEAAKSYAVADVVRLENAAVREILKRDAAP